MIRRPTYKRIKFVFLIATLFLTVIFILLYLRISNLIEASDRVDHTRQVQLELENVYTEILQAETSQRGFILSSDSTLLTDFHNAVTRLNRRLSIIEIMVMDNAIQKKNMHELRAMVDERITFLTSFLDFKPHDPVSVRIRVKGKQLRNNLRRQINKVQEYEEDLLKEQTERRNRESWITPMGMIFLFFASVAIVLATYFKMIQYLRASYELRKALQQRENKLVSQTKKLLEAQQLAHVGSWDWDVEANVMVLSEELLRIYGITPENVPDSFEKFLKHIHPEDREYAQELVHDSIEKREPFKLNYRIIRPDNSVRTINATGKVYSRNGKAVRLTGTAHDVTEQKRREDALIESESRFMKMFEDSPVATTLTEIGTNVIRYANKGFFHTFGYKPEEVIGHMMSDFNFIDPEENLRIAQIILNSLKEERSLDELKLLSPEETEALLIKIRQSDVIKQLEITYNRKNGEKFPATVSFEIISFRNQTYVLSSVHDISPQKETEALLKKQNLDLELANNELESFNYITSHDLQEPLRHIQLFASRVIETEQKNLSKKGQEYLERVQFSAQRMQNLIFDLLEYSLLNKDEAQFEITNLDMVVDEVLENFAETIIEKNATIEYQGLGELKVIQFQFRQLMSNLIGNSLKFSRAGVKPLIKITRSDIIADASKPKLIPGNAYAHLRVTDNGIGFEPAYNEHIFEVFKRLLSKDEVAGSGIGLAIVKKIVENHKGLITATGEPDKGAVFDIYLPL